MPNRQYPRDLVMIGAIFGLATFIWAGWAQESPPDAVVWRVVLGVLSLAGIALAAMSIPLAIRNWHAPTAIDPRSRAFRLYVIVFWVEVVCAVVLSILPVTAGRSDLIAPLILVVVGVHFFALGVVFHQPLLHVAAVLLTVISVLAALVTAGDIAPSFWCGILGAPVFLAVGASCSGTGRGTLRGEGPGRQDASAA